MQDQIRHTNNQRGFATIIAVVISLGFAASIVGISYVISTSAGKVAAGQTQQITLEEFAEGMIATCPSFVDFTLLVGESDEYNTNITDLVNNSPSIQWGVQGSGSTNSQSVVGEILLAEPSYYPQYSGPSASTPSFFDNDFGDLTYSDWEADLLYTWNYFEGFFDIDIHYTNFSQGLEQGVFDQEGQASINNNFTCRFFATDLKTDRRIVVTAYVRKKIKS